jgi:GT2 family glycosyltransferase
MPDAPRVSIIIVTWNGLHLLQRCLPSVLATAYPNLEVIVADNASTDGTAGWLQRTHPGVKVVCHPENWAFCRGNNAAVPDATGEFVLLLNNDIEVPPGWLWPLVHEMTADPTVAAVQPKLLQIDDRQRFEYAGAAGGHLDRLGYPFTRGRLFFTMESDAGQYDAPTDIFWATGAALLLRRSALDTVGLLDERFRLHMEEIDLCWRLHRAGYRVRVAPASEVYHIGGASLPQGSPEKVYYNFRNSLLLLYKHLPPSQWRRVFPERVLHDTAAVGRALALGKPAEAGAIVRAYADAHRMKSAFAADRPMETDSVVPPSYKRSIVWDYFMRGRRRFQELPSAAFARRFRPQD